MVRGVNTGSSWSMDPWLVKAFQCSSSDYVLVLRFHGGQCGVEWRNTLVPDTDGGKHSLLCECYCCMACVFGLLSLKSNLVSR